MLKLEDWSLCNAPTQGVSTYHAPEDQDVFFLQGNLFEDPHTPPGTRIVTTNVASIDWEHRIASDFAGKTYALGSTDPGWITWLHNTGRVKSLEMINQYKGPKV